MRLIDADALIEDLKGSLFYSDAIPLVEDAPTAYDVDAVAEELERQAEQNRNRGFEHEAKGYSAMADKYYGKYCSYEYATEIVRKGGVNE